MGATTNKTSYVGMKLAVNKIFTNNFLSLDELPVPLQMEVDSENDLEKMFERCSKIIMKPYGSRCGKGVMTEIIDVYDAIEKLGVIKKDFSRVIAEEQVEGSDHRVLVIGDRVVAVLHRKPPFVIGDGKSTIQELIEKENSSEVRMKGELLKPIKVDEEIIGYLKKKELEMDSVLGIDEKVELTNIANISAGGIGVAVTDKIHPENSEIAIKAAQSLGLDVAGVDIITSSIEEPLSETGGKIIEVNGGPDLRIHYYVSEGESVNPGEAIVKNLLNLK
jgi:cyanophycin synthetase